MAIVGGILVAVGALLAFFSRRSGGRAALMKATETSRIGELTSLVDEIRADLPGSDGTGFTQFVELKGRVVCDEPVMAELSAQQVAIADTRVERIVETRHEVRDSQGHVRTEWRKTHETVSQNRREAVFHIDDGSGRVRVSTAGAKLDLEKVVDRFEQPGVVEQGATGQLTVGIGSFRMAIGSMAGGGRRTVGYRFEERVLPTQRELYVLGEVADTSDGLVLRKPEERGRPFLLSLKNEDEVVRSTESSARWMKIGGGLLAVAGIALVVIGLLR